MKKIFFFLAAMALAITANAKVTTISPDAENDALRLAVHYAEDGDIIEMTEGTYVQCNNGYVAFDGKSVTVKAAEGANVVLQLQVPITLANGGKATLQGIKIDASRLTELADWYEHVIYANDATEGKELVMDGCELYGFNMNKSAIYSKADNKLDLCRINNCYFHDVEKSCLFFEGTSIAELSVTNSTFANNIAKVTDSYYAGIIDVRNADAKVTVDHCTFYNCLLMNTDYAAITMKGPQAANVVISNNIFMLPEAIDGHRAIREYVEATNCMTFNYVKDNGGIHSSVTKTNCQLNVDPKFVDAANGNFALAEGSPALTAGTDGKAIGDPRWNVVAEPEPTTETVYFINTKKWAAVKAHVWGGKAAESAWPGKATVKETEKVAGYDVYSFTANVGDYANIIFNNNNGGSQTADLVWTAGKYYVIDMGWLTKEEAETKLAAPLPETWNIVGDAGLMGKGWDLNAAENAMTQQADGTYLLEKKDITITAGTYEYKAAKDHGWTVSVPQDGNQKLTISKSGIYDITFVLNVTAKTLKATATLKKEAVVIPTVIIAGDMNSWNQTKDKFTMAADSLTATFKATLTAKSYGFKMIVGGAWLSDGKTITRAANSTKFTGANSSNNSTLKADIAGEYLFTWEYATKTLTVTYPELPVEYTVTATVNPAETGTVAGAGKYEEGKTATLTATPAEGYQFVNWTVGEEVVSTENPYSFVVTADVALVANFELIPPTKYNVTVTAENGTVEGAGEYEEGKTATLTATANEGYEFINWLVDDVEVSDENPYTFTVTADIALVANFQATEPVVEVPAASVRAWAYDLALAVEGEQYTFSYKATTAALATLIFTDVDGEELATKDLGLVEAGANTVVLAADELPAGQKVNWAVKLEAGAIANFVELTDASKGIYNFYLPQGVAVDNNPESSTFGNIYVAAATDGASDGSSNRADTQKRGIFIYDQELNELNPTSNVGIIPSNVTLGTTTRQAMKRLVIDPTTNNVAFVHNANPIAIWAVPAENVAGEATNLIADLGFTAAQAACFDENGDLYVLVSPGYPSKGSLYKVVDGEKKALFEENSRFGNADVAMASDGRGGIWICQNRGQLDTYNQLTHVNAAGEIDFAVNTATPNGFESKNTARGTIAYNPKEDVLALSIGTGSSIGASLYSVVYDAETGVPSLTYIAATPAMGKNVDGLAFDYAGDLYALSANQERLYKYAVPTENNVCTTPAASKYAFQVEGSGPGEYYEDVITNMTFDLENMVIIGGPSENFQIDVYLVLGEDDGSGEFQLTEESSVAVMGSDAKFIEGIAYEIDAYAPAALVDLVVEWNGKLYQFHLTMSAAPMEATKVVVENATIEVEKYLLFGDTYDYALTMTGVWNNEADGLTYPVLVEVPVYYPEATEPSTILSTVTVGGWGDDEPWLGFGEGELTITTVGETVTAAGIVENPMAGIAIDITISGSLSQGPGTGLENATITIKAVKMIQNGQLIVKKGDVQYNVQGQVIK